MSKKQLFIESVTAPIQKMAALELADQLGQMVNGVTAEQIVNHALASYFRQTVPTLTELKDLSKSLTLITKMGIKWDPAHVPSRFQTQLDVPLSVYEMHIPNMVGDVFKEATRPRSLSEAPVPFTVTLIAVEGATKNSNLRWLVQMSGGGQSTFTKEGAFDSSVDAEDWARKYAKSCGSVVGTVNRKWLKEEALLSEAIHGVSRRIVNGYIAELPMQRRWGKPHYSPDGGETWTSDKKAAWDEFMARVKDGRKVLRRKATPEDIKKYGGKIDEAADATKGYKEPTEMDRLKTRQDFEKKQLATRQFKEKQRAQEKEFEKQMHDKEHPENKQKK